MRFIRSAVAISALMLAAWTPLMAQTCAANPCTVQVTASATVPDVVQLTLSTTTFDLGAPSSADFTAGYKEIAGPTATVQSNRPWHVDVVAANVTAFTYSGSLTDPNKASSDLKWGTVSGTYPNNASSSAVLKSGVAGGGITQQIFFKTLWSLVNDVPGTYSLVVNFTLSAP
jgi:hypothetical protein